MILVSRGSKNSAHVQTVTVGSMPSAYRLMGTHLKWVSINCVPIKIQETSARFVLSRLCFWAVTPYSLVCRAYRFGRNTILFQGLKRCGGKYVARLCAKHGAIFHT